MPMTFKEAQEWAEEHLDGDDYCEIFGEPDEGAEDVLLGIRVSAAAAAKLKRIAAEEGKTQSAILDKWIMDAQ